MSKELEESTEELKPETPVETAAPTDSVAAVGTTSEPSENTPGAIDQEC